MQTFYEIIDIDVGVLSIDPVGDLEVDESTKTCATKAIPTKLILSVVLTQKLELYFFLIIGSLNI